MTPVPRTRVRGNKEYNILFWYQKCISSSDYFTFYAFSK